MLDGGKMIQRTVDKQPKGEWEDGAWWENYQKDGEELVEEKWKDGSKNAQKAKRMMECGSEGWQKTMDGEKMARKMV